MRVMAVVCAPWSCGTEKCPFDFGRMCVPEAYRRSGRRSERRSGRRFGGSALFYKPRREWMLFIRPRREWKVGELRSLRKWPAGAFLLSLSAHCLAQ